MSKPWVIDCIHYVDDMREDGMGFLAADCACGWRCPPAPDEETRIDFLMQHAFEAGLLAVAQREGAEQ